MSKALIWIGGATLATVLLFGGASIGARFLDTGAETQSVAAAPDLEDAIPVDPSRFGDGTGTQAGAQALDPEAEADTALTDETIEPDEATAPGTSETAPASAAREGETVRGDWSRAS